jgi:hypothetical protein
MVQPSMEPHLTSPHGQQKVAADADGSQKTRDCHGSSTDTPIPQKAKIKTTNSQCEFCGSSSWRPIVPSFHIGS